MNSKLLPKMFFIPEALIQCTVSSQHHIVTNYYRDILL